MVSLPLRPPPPPRQDTEVGGSDVGDPGPVQASAAVCFCVLVFNKIR